MQGELDDNVRPAVQEKFVASYRAAGGECEYEVFAGCEHLWVGEPGPQTDRAHEMVKQFIAEAVEGEGISGVSAGFTTVGDRAKIREVWDDFCARSLFTVLLTALCLRISLPLLGASQEAGDRSLSWRRIWGGPRATFIRRRQG